MHEAWYVTITRSRSEMQVVEALKELDVTNRCYRVRRKLPQKGHLVERLLPAFTGYVFTYSNAEWYHQIRKVDGVVNFLSMDRDGYPTPIAATEISRLDSMADDDLVFGTYDPQTGTYHKGDIIRILSGPFVHFMGRFLENDRTVFVCEVEMMGRSVPIGLGFHQIELVKRHKKQRSRRINRCREDIAVGTPA